MKKGESKLNSRLSSQDVFWSKFGLIAALLVLGVGFFPVLLIMLACVIAVSLGEWLSRASQRKYTSEQLRLLAHLELCGYDETVLYAYENELPPEIHAERARLREEARLAGLSEDDSDEALRRGTVRATWLLNPEPFSLFG